jgi:hypothetical protein
MIVNLCFPLKKSLAWGLLSVLCSTLGHWERCFGPKEPQNRNTAASLGLFKVPHSCRDKKRNMKPRSITQPVPPAMPRQNRDLRPAVPQLGAGRRMVGFSHPNTQGTTAVYGTRSLRVLGSRSWLSDANRSGTSLGQWQLPTRYLLRKKQPHWSCSMTWKQRFSYIHSDFVFLFFK